MTEIAIIGGGPGGLISAHLLECKSKDSCEITLFEATDRIGGKILTQRFDSAPVLYEAGVAEVYDYEMIGPDPLRQLIANLGLKTKPIEGGTVVLNGKLLRNEDELRLHCGEATLRSIQDFRRRAAAMMPIEAWVEGFWQDDNNHPWARRTCEEILNEVVDPTARKFLKAMVHTDLATEPHLTSGLNGLKNFVMDLPGYIRQHSIEGGMEMLPRRLQESLTHTCLALNSPVTRVEKNPDNSYRVCFRRGRRIAQQDFDAVVIALPHNWLNSIEWASERLRRAMTEHIAYYDRPAHYLRISALFQKPFWRKLIPGSWFMLDAFGGCCVYDEGARHDVGEYGVLGWLLAGADALRMVNLDNLTLIDHAIESLPEELYKEARECLLEGKVHRWAAAVNGQPGGLPVREARAAHLPEAAEHPGIFVVGDYLFDSTLNGVFDSANFATDLLESWIERKAIGNHAAVRGKPKRKSRRTSEDFSRMGMKELLPGKLQRALVKHCLTIALLILLHIPGSALAQGVDQTGSPRLASGFETDFNPRYVHRGLAFSQGPVNQSSAWITISGLTFYAWGNLVLDDAQQQGELDEVDVGVSYTYEWKKLTLEPAFDYFIYRSPAPLKDPPTGEVSIKVSRPVGPAQVFTKQTVDIGSYRGAYFGEAGLSYERQLDQKTTVRTAFNAGWASARFNDAYIGVPKHAFNLIGAEVSITYAPSPRFYLRPHFELTRIADSQLRRHLDSPTIGNFGLALGFNLNLPASR